MRRPGLIEVAALDVVGAGLAVVHVGLYVRERGEERPGLGRERMLAAVACAVQPPDLSVRVLLRECLKHGENGGGADPGADQQHGRVCLIEDEGASWCCDVELVADRETGVQIAAGDAIGFVLDGNPVVARPGWARERVVAQHRPLLLVGLDAHGEVLTRAGRW